jgi:hypothetical protein
MTDFENVKRYDVYSREYEGWSEQESDFGDYVKYPDYESLLFAYNSLLQQYKQEFVNKELEKKVLEKKV